MAQNQRPKRRTTQQPVARMSVSWRPAMLAVALAVLAFALYAPTFANGRVIDDDDLLTIDLSPSEIVLEPELIEGSPYYRPVTVATYSMLHVFSEGSARTAAAHLGNLFLYSLSAASVYWLCRDALRGQTAATAGAAVATLVFVVHPIHTESVAWITARPDMIVGLLIVGAIAAMRRYGERPSRYWLALASSLIFLAPLAKEAGAVSILLVPLYQALCIQRGRSRAGEHQRRLTFVALVRPLLPSLYVAAAAAVAYLALRLVALDGIGDSGLAWEMLRPGPLFGAIGFYADKLFAPRNLIAYYGAVPSGGWQFAAGIAASVAWLAAFVASLRFGARSVTFALLWMALTLTLSMPFFVAEPSIAPIAERYLYLPSIGAALLVAWAVSIVIARMPDARLGQLQHLKPRTVLAWTAFGGAVACLVALFAVMTVTRLPDWDSVGRYWETVAEDNPNAGFAQAALASVDWQAGRIEEAEAGYQRALAGDLDDRRRALVLIDLGALRAGREDYDGAAAAYYEGIGLFSGFWDLHYNLALARWKQALLTDPPDAAHLREAYDAAGRAAEINDDAPELFLLQGLIAKDAGDRDAAEVALRRVLDLDPNAATARSARDALEQLDQSP